MKTSKTALFLGLCSLGLAAIGCREPRSARDAEGTLEFVVRPFADVGGSMPQGSFEIRGIDNDEHARVGIGSSAARTLSLRLPAGAYSVSWRPASGLVGEPARQRDLLQGAQIVVVAPDHSATVDAFGAAQRTRGALASARATRL